jgi:prevent-host-death family protein
MSAITANTLHVETSDVLDDVEQGRAFNITRRGKIIGRIIPAKDRSRKSDWDEIMSPVWEAQKRVKATTPNPVLGERARRRR